MERTPGLESKGFNFWKKFEESVEAQMENIKFEMEVSEFVIQYLFFLNRTKDININFTRQKIFLSVSFLIVMIY